MKLPKRPPVKFVGHIKKVVTKIDIAGDKVANMVVEFYATDANLAQINSLQQPETNVEITMEKMK